MMNLVKTMSIAVFLASFSVPAIADSGHHPEQAASSSSAMPMAGGQMPMMQDQRNMPMMGGGMEGMPMMKMMQERHAMMQRHMTKMESRMANMEALLKELVALQKK